MITDLHWRSAAAADLDELTAVVQAAERADRRPELTPREELEKDLVDPDTDPARHTVVVERDGEIVGYGYCFVRPDPGPTHHFAHLFAYVHPDHRGVVDDALFVRVAQLGEAALATRRHALPAALRTSAMEWQHEDLARFSRLGFSPIRWFVVMSVEVTDGAGPGRPTPTGAVPGRWVRRAPATVPGLPPVLPWRDAFVDATADAHREAFADHWGSTPVSRREWRRRTAGDPFFRPDLSFVAASEDGRVAAYLIAHHYPGDEEFSGRRESWVSTLGVRPEARGQGLGTALLTAHLEAVDRDPALTHAGLDVDAASPTGANRIYERVGFAPLYRSVSYARFLS